MHFFRGLIAIVSICGAACGADPEPALPEIPEIKLKPVRWQVLPAGVSRVIVAPNGRTWYQHRIPYGTNVTLEEIKQQIASQFTRPSPQIAFATLLLVEPGGRAWFTDPGKQTILGYDGKDWITRKPASRTDEHTGCPPTRGRLFTGSYHRCIDGIVWLLSDRGLERFDGQHWQSLEMPTLPNQERFATKLAVSPDGKLTVAAGSTINVYRDGKWTSSKLNLGRKNATLYDIAATDSETLWCHLNTGDMLIAKVAADGTLSLTDPQQELPGTSLRLDQLRGVANLLRDSKGALYAVSRALESPLGKSPGVLFVRGNKEMHLLVGESALGWLPHFAGFLPPILANSGKELWIPNCESKRPPALVDLKTQKELDVLPNDQFRILYAVDNEGRVFASERNIGITDDPIMVYAPGLPKEPSLKPHAYDIADHRIAVEDTGAVWARDRSQRVIRIADDREPVVYPELEMGQQHSFLPGREGLMLVCFGRKAALFQRGTLVATGGLLELIEEQLDLICRGFAADNPPSQSERDVMLVATPGRQVWCLREQSLWYYTDGAWKDTSAPLKQAGSRYGLLKYLAAIGDGSRVFVGDLAFPSDGGGSYIATVKDDKFVFEEADHIRQDYKVTYAVRDPSDALWLRVTTSKFSNLPRQMLGQYAVRLDAKGERSEIVNRGWATLVDQSGNAWLEEAVRKPGSVVHLCREGKIVQELEIPGFGKYGILFATQPGRVYAWSSSGLQQLLGEGPTGIPYRLGEHWQVEGIEGTVAAREYARGTLAIATYVDFPSRRYLLHLIDVSKL
jgi:hypothetical protein